VRNGTIIFPIATDDCAAANAASNREGGYNISGSDRLNVDGNKFEQAEMMALSIKHSPIVEMPLFAQIRDQ